MKSLSGIGLGLSVVFGCLVLALFAEFYYLLCWKKRITSRTIEEGYNNTPTKELLHIFCCKKPTSLGQTALNPQELSASGLISNTQLNDSQNQLQQLQVHSNKDILVKPCEEESMETELMRLHKLGGPPRFLFTIVEETKEDLESEDGRSRGEKGSRGRSLSDLLFTVETPFLTPLASPSLFTPPLTSPANTYQNPHGFNPLFESSTDAEFSRIRASPPPKFKFLQDAEEKLRKKVREDSERNVREVNCQHHLSPAQTKKLDGFLVNPIHNNPCTMNRELVNFQEKREEDWILQKEVEMKRWASRQVEDRWG
ncbi:hypothetical protein NL676_037154 [Syzygium grande]|nr:hypothetical protein NL676_037154 [Syzygium grande]